MAVADEYPGDLLYHPDHDWARISEGEATLGVTWYAQDQLGEIVYWDPPAVGDELVKGRPYAELESVKAVSEVIAPLSGEIVAVNAAVAESPEKVNEEPYEAGWLVRIRLSDASEAEDLLTADAYKELVTR